MVFTSLEIENGVTVTVTSDHDMNPKMIENILTSTWIYSTHGLIMMVPHCMQQELQWNYFEAIKNYWPLQ